MDQANLLTGWFEEHRVHLRSVAYRMLGSLAEADDAVQEAWLRANHAGTAEIENARAWLTTIVARVCLNMLRSRRTRREESLDVHVPDPVVEGEDGSDPEQEALLADAVGLALQVVVDTLAPAERLAFVLHDMFDVPFDDIAALVGRSPDAARQLASRARRRVRASAPAPDAELTAQRAVVDAFLNAARAGDLQSLVAVLDPDVVLRADGGTARPLLSRAVRGAEAVARGALAGSRGRPSAVVRPVLVNGAAGVIVIDGGQTDSVWGITVAGGRIVEIDIVFDLDRIRQLGLSDPKP